MRHKYLLAATCLILVMAFAAAFAAYQGANVLSGPSPFAAIFPADAPDCPALCWHNIRLGETTLTQAKARIQTDPTFKRADYMSDDTLRWEYAADLRVSFFAMRSSGNVWIDEIQVYLPYQAFTVLDAINHWGEPIGLYMLSCNGSDGGAEAEIFFEGGVRVHTSALEMVASIGNLPTYHLSPDADLYMLFFFTTPSIDDNFFIPWNEFRQWTHESWGFSGYC